MKRPPSQRAKEVFFRNEDPDKRTEKQWLKDFELRNIVKKAKRKRESSLWYPNFKN